MAHEFFEKYTPRGETWDLLNHITEIVEDYAGQGLTLTLRQLYYQLVSKDLIPNHEKSYKKIGSLVSNARRGGLLDWDALEDRVRRPERPSEFRDLDELIQAALASFRLPRFQGQEHYVELWVEKDALAGVLQPIARRYHITLMINRGYSSTSAMKSSGERIRTACRELMTTSAYILYLGDMDPSGEDMVRDVSERLHEYVNSGTIFHKVSKSREKEDGEVEEYMGFELEAKEERIARLMPRVRVEVEKLALTMDQIEEYSPPPNPAKRTDSRAGKYIAKHGDESWEVDALPPRVLRDIIEERLDELINQDVMDRIRKREERDKKLLVEAVKSLRKET